MRPQTARRAGLLLHPSSLPGEQATGGLGRDAFRFVDFLADAGFSLWQVLPMGPVDATGSPYNSPSAFAGDPRLISQEELPALGLSPSTPMTPDPYLHSMPLMSAFDHFINTSEHPFAHEITVFRERNRDWLDDYALFCAIKINQEGRAWAEWPAALRDRDTQALEAFREQNRLVLDYFYFEQCVFFSQWSRVKAHAHSCGISVIGDIPIFVAWDSADVWAHREFFLLDESGKPVSVAGVPPDYFSPDGQRWGNPLYDWPRLAENGFDWWLQRMRHALQLYDIVRIDHFRGFCACWEIPASATTAREGQWCEVPGQTLFDTLQKHLGNLPVIAEDLGIITDDVVALREHYHLPGMSILQFAFDGSKENPYLPHHLDINTVVYTGTHDNDTTLGWFSQLTEEEKSRVQDYFGYSREEMPWPLIRAALASVAQTAILPMQDILALDGIHRMNRPGTETGNWQWRFHWDQLPENIAGRLRHMLTTYGRLQAR